MARKLTAGQRVVLRALEDGRRSVGVAPGALGRIVSSLYDQGFVSTSAMSIHRQSQFGGLVGWSITKAGRDALEAETVR